jgi:hypothetical protein
MPAWLSSATRERTKCLQKIASERDTRIDDKPGGSPLTIETASVFPIGIRGAPDTPEQMTVKVHLLKTIGKVRKIVA